MVHHFILLQLNPFDLRADKEELCLEQSVSSLQVCLSAEGTKTVSWPKLSPLRGWGSLTILFDAKFVCRAHDFIFLQLNPFDLRFEQTVLKAFPGPGYFRSQNGLG